MDNTKIGHYHPITIAIRDIERIFRGMGFSVASGPEVETEHYNFDALNIPKDHPARDLWDTFWLKAQIDADTKNTRINADDNPRESASDQRASALLLRTHTSPVQVRYMETHKPPIAIISPGKTYRYEATDATHEAQFYQVEGLLIDIDVTLANLRAVLAKFLGEFFGADLSVRLRPSYFPFVEPGVEVDMSCFNCDGKGLILMNRSTGNGAGKDITRSNYKACSVCKGSGWVEIMGAGMVHPSVLSGVGIDPREYSGFAFGAGIERLAILKYGIDDIRALHNGDLRVVTQF